MSTFPLRHHARRFADFAAIALLGLGVVYWTSGWHTTGAPERPNVLGKRLPDVVLQTTDGVPVKLSEMLGKRATLIYVMSPAQCAGCSNLPLEFKIIRRELPWIQPLIIGSGATKDAFREALLSNQLREPVWVDEARDLLDSLGIDSEPLTVLVDSTRRIIFVDFRSVSAAAQYPMGMVLHQLADVFSQRSKP